MPLDPVVLDDLTWSDLMSLVRSRIPAASSGRWTLHAPVDPGITLLELYAHLFELRLYWMDQPCDNRVRALLRLLGASPRPVGSAATVLAASATEGGELPASTPFDLADDGPSRSTSPPLRFTTRDDQTLLPLSEPGGGVGLIVGGVDRSIDLARGRKPSLFPLPDDLPPHAAPSFDIVLRLGGPMPSSGPPMGLLIDIDAPSSIPAEWLPGAAEIAPPTRLTWSCQDKSGAFVPFDPSTIHDGTGGLRRSGVVRLPVPPAGGPDGALRLRVEGHWLGPSPRARRITPNAVVATHAATTVVVANGTNQPAGSMANTLSRRIADWIMLPGTTLELPGTAGSLIPESVRFQLEEFDGRLQDWTPRDDFSRSGPADRHFVADRATGSLRFGDGYNGRIPHPAPPTDQAISAKFSISFAVGGGTGGNLEAGLLWRSPGADMTAKNVVPARGGVEPEDVASAAARAGAAWADPTRTVTPNDFADLAVTTPGAGVRRAIAEIGRHPQRPHRVVPGAVTVSIVPDQVDHDAQPPTPDPGVLEAVKRRLEEARLVTQEVFVKGPEYRDASITVILAGRPDDPAGARASVSSALRSLLHPLTGGFDGHGWPFGGAISPSTLMRRVSATLDDEIAIVRVIISPGNDPTKDEDCVDVAIPPHALVRLVEVNVQFVDRPTSKGVLS